MAGRKPNELAWNAERLRTASNAAGVALWCWDVETDAISLDERAHELWGVTNERPVCFEDLSAHIHPADIERVRRDLDATLGISGPYEIDFRILLADETRWISARGHGGQAGLVGSLRFAVFMDVTARKRAEEVREMLAGEMTHRIKNLFAIASALTTIADRSTSTKTEMAADLKQRLHALGRAQDLVRPVPGRDEKKAAMLDDLLSTLVAPYNDPDGGSPQVRINVPELQVSENAITTLALVVHELATNSLKYGALSDPAGTIDVTAAMDDVAFTVTWREQGGPPVVKPHQQGFGTKLIDQSMAAFGGAVTFDWRSSGLVATIRMNKSKLS